ncbi:MAG TPA: FHA domain-containing protein [Polyangiaceae bacterium]|nr:FHA domain-containing protein [Polyangiaceae bacterium]
MPRIFGRVFGRGALVKARAAELRGDLAQAAVLFAQAGRLDEAARVMLLRGDAEADAPSRLRHYAQAAAAAPPGSDVQRQARLKRATAVLLIASDVPMTAAMRQELAHAAGELEDVGSHALAADAYARAGDIEGQARALARSGDIDRLDAVLAAQQAREHEATRRRLAHEELAALVACGKRRQAAALARASGDEGLREQGRLLEQRAVLGRLVNAVLRERLVSFALGDEVVVGRAGGGAASAGATIGVPSAAVSRRHVAVARRGREVVVRDLGSRNGTTLRGLALTGEAPVGAGVELLLGGQVTMVVAPHGEPPGSVSIDVAGARWIAPLGPAMLGVGRWRLETAPAGDGLPADWVELATDRDPAAFAGGLELAPRVTLLAGDSFTAERAGPPVLEIRRDER